MHQPGYRLPRPTIRITRGCRLISVVNVPYLNLFRKYHRERFFSDVSYLELQPLRECHIQPLSNYQVPEVDEWSIIAKVYKSNQKRIKSLEAYCKGVNVYSVQPPDRSAGQNRGLRPPTFSETSKLEDKVARLTKSRRKKKNSHRGARHL